MSDAARLLRDVDPLESGSPEDWDRLIEAMGVASLLVVIEQRMGPRLRRSIQPEDVLQDALLHAWRDRAKCEWRGLAIYRSWFLSVVEHRLRDLAERESRLERGLRVEGTDEWGRGSSRGVGGVRHRLWARGDGPVPRCPARGTAAMPGRDLVALEGAWSAWLDWTSWLAPLHTSLSGSALDPGRRRRLRHR